MFSKLAFKNVGRSMKDYGVWFLTIAFGVCLFYVFNSLETQAVFQYLGSGPQAPTAQAIRELIGMLSVFVWVVLAFLILYASGFLIRRRKGELGTYLLLGMERGRWPACSCWKPCAWGCWPCWQDWGWGCWRPGACPPSPPGSSPCP